MSILFKSCAASVLLAVACAAPAADDASPAGDAPVALGQVAVRDATTGRLREATAAEMKALQAAAPAPQARKSAGATRTKHHKSGATGARLNDNFLSYSVMVKQPDGRLLEYCFGSKEDAEAAVSAAPSSSQSNPAPTE